MPCDLRTPREILGLTTEQCDLWVEPLVCAEATLLCKEQRQADTDALPMTGLRVGRVIQAMTGANEPGWLHMCVPGGNVTFKYNFYMMDEGRLYFKHIGDFGMPMIIAWKSAIGDRVLTVSGSVRNGMLKIEASNMAGETVFGCRYSLQEHLYVSALRQQIKHQLVFERTMASTQNLKLVTPGGRVMQPGRAVWIPTWPRTRRKVQLRVFAKVSQAQALISEYFRRRN